MAEIRLENISKSFGSVSVIRDISLTVNAGELVVFLGPSGSGKSTLLRMIAGLETIDSGALTIGGVRSDTLPPGQRNIAMVFQNYALYPHMSVRDNMAFGLENIGVDKTEIETRVTTAARMLEMEHLLSRKPAQLSGGQRQRVAIGRAIVKEPKAFLFDEPLSNLDAALRVRTRVELAQLHQRLKSTMIYVTHDQTEAMTLADRIVVLNQCKIEQIGTPMEVYLKPASRFVAGFIGSPGMNFLSVDVVRSGRTPIRFPNGFQLEIEAPVPAPGKFDLGIRPESVRIVTGEDDPARPSTEAKVDVVEQLGERTLAYCTLEDGSPFIAQDSGRSQVRPGDRVRVALDTSAIHLFDADGRSYQAV
ncbi:ABC transporter ATP-binding protein [Rhizobium sp. TRM95796]|uniref:ABC transporter ATP-binding protein n=1 Tax=Rhizobium sp. TRM95796 TaxID=2979862 RepID=UPI0021E8D0C1|nr:sn-glycerol-3-phosphate ABC transporter ATP-binding protein UgpC [Rhizobium sp. TRM95796]MCV3766491.1 sn-glycerol-3-phosphate ABC transporter ATP-binding protein UgpC [Rhizobium sp. TRM95796]